MAKSIISNVKECVCCGREDMIHKHHIYGGSRRRTSEREGFWMYLCPAHHNMSDAGIHFNADFDRKVKAKCQEIYERTHSHEEFMLIIGRNYI